MDVISIPYLEINIIDTHRSGLVVWTGLSRASREGTHVARTPSFGCAKPVSVCRSSSGSIRPRSSLNVSRARTVFSGFRGTVVPVVSRNHTYTYIDNLFFEKKNISKNHNLNYIFYFNTSDVEYYY